MDLRDLEVFLAVAERLHFTRAAADLHVAQPALSAQISRLEKELGVRLFERTSRSVAITPAAEELQAWAVKILADVASARADMAAHAGALHGRVGLGTGQVFLRWLPPLLGDLRTEHPGVDFVLREGMTPELVDRLRRSQLDAAFVVLAGQVPDGFHATLGASQQLGVAVAPDHRFARRDGVSPSDLATEGLIVFRPGSVFRDLALAVVTRAGHLPRITLETGELTTARALAAAGLGAAFLPMSMIGVDDPSVVLVPLTVDNPVWRPALIWPKERRLSAAAVAVISAMQSQFLCQFGAQDRSIAN
jgi:LysR family transcriptional regulator, transcription activator of glutamate synthase operon